MVTGFIDVGFAKAQGNGTSYPPGDLRVPADYGVDTFATAVNSRGDVASNDPNGRFVNGFLPRSMGIGGHGSVLFNALSADLRYTSRGAPLFVFARAVMLPRLSAAGDQTRVLLEQGFGRLTPLDSAELAISIGKFDSVFGIEYLENPSNIRIGITPSLMARYTTGTSLGAKVFYRIQIPIIWSALSLNVAGTNSGNFVEALQGPDANLTGVPVASGTRRLRVEPAVGGIKLGASGLQGPRNDQRDPDSRQRMWGFDARLYVAGLALNGEYVHVDEESGSVPKLTGDGLFPLTHGVSRARFLRAGDVRPPDHPAGVPPPERLRARRTAPRLVRGLQAGDRPARYGWPAPRPVGRGGAQRGDARQPRGGGRAAGGEQRSDELTGLHMVKPLNHHGHNATLSGRPNG